MQTPFAILALASCATAQFGYFLPPEYERAWGRASTAVLGNNSTRTQLVYAAPFGPGTVVLGIRFRPGTTHLDRAAFTADVEIRCSSGPLAPGSLSTTFANNVGSDELIVLPQQTVNIPAMPANRGTGALAEFLFATPFVFGLNGNTNLVVEVKVFSRSPGATWTTDRAFAATGGRAAAHGRGCGTGSISSTSTAGYVAGSTINVNLVAAHASTIALLVPTFDQKEFAPQVPLPFDLALVGAATGCDLLVNPQVGGFAFLTDIYGAVTVQVPVPAGVGQLGLGFQWAWFVPPTAANPLGLETSGVQAVWLGPEVCAPFYGYVWDLQSASATTGVVTDGIPVAELIIQ